MAYCDNTCKRNCKTFREHVGNGPAIDGKCMPTRSNIAALQAKEDRWQRDGDALDRLGKEGHNLPHLDGAAELEKRATHPIELAHGRIYGEAKATAFQALDDATK